jgi:subtilisin family serine protease
MGKFTGVLTVVLLWAVCGISVSFAQGNNQASSKRPFVIYSQDTAAVPANSIRHRFGDKFTASLSSNEAGSLRKAGYKLRPVGKSTLSKPPGACDPWPQCKKDGGDDTGSRPLPDDQTPWGIEFVYDDSGIATTSGGQGINVAVLDSGVNTDHPDLINRVTQCVDFTKRGVVTGSCSDQNGHGTHVAGTIAADGGDDQLGIFGVAPQANILAYKVCKGTNCWNDDMAAGLLYAADNGAHIISMSIGSDFESDLLNGAIAQIKDTVLIVVAAGNDGPKEGSIDYPAANPDVIAVAAMDAENVIANWSSRGIDDGDDNVIGKQEIELAGPGVTVESTWKDGYAYYNGTSMATPHISGLAAKLWQGDAATTRTLLRSIAEDIEETGYDISSGYGAPHLGNLPY